MSKYSIIEEYLKPLKKELEQTDCEINEINNYKQSVELVHV